MTIRDVEEIEIDDSNDITDVKKIQNKILENFPNGRFVFINDEKLADVGFINGIFQVIPVINDSWKLLSYGHQFKAEIKYGTSYNKIDFYIETKIEDLKKSIGCEDDRFDQVSNYSMTIYYTDATDNDEDKISIKNIRSPKKKQTIKQLEYKNFCKTERIKIKEELPGLTMQDTARELGKRWQEFKIANLKNK